MRSLLAALLALLGCSDTTSTPRPSHPGDRDDGGLLPALDAQSADPNALEPNDPDPILCGGAYDSPCHPDKYCAWYDGCGTAGNCFRREQSCDEAPEQVCGCDGTTYESECAAAMVGVSLLRFGPCEDKARQFHCGSFVCDRQSYCLDDGEQRDPDQQRFFCLSFPPGCEDCSCLEELDVGCYFGASCKIENGHVVVTCQR